MLRNFLLSWIVVAVAFAITAWLLDGVSVSGGITGYLWISLLFGIINAIVGTILRILSLPFIILTLGLMLVLINAVVLAITDSLTGDLTIQSFFWDAIWAAIVLSIATVVVGWVVRGAARTAS
ncbi:MAG TPA: phage holin family protein [Gaiellales bacterium]|jgi:putative membrane protein|nr:phage holin family protein [Gaiellales bacterium]